MRELEEFYEDDRPPDLTPYEDMTLEELRLEIEKTEKNLGIWKPKKNTQDKASDQSGAFLIQICQLIRRKTVGTSGATT